MSPTTNISDDHTLSFGLGDITLGDKTSAQGDGAVALGGSTHGDIVTGHGALLGNGNTVNNGDIHAGAGSTVTVGDGDTSSHVGTVIQTSGDGTTTVSDGNTTNVQGSQTISDIHGTANTVGVNNSSTLTHTSLHDNPIHETTHTATGLDAHLGF
jgi:hypothetical protein